MSLQHSKQAIRQGKLRKNMYITAFASISSLSLEIEAIFCFQSKKNTRGKLKAREISTFV